MTINSFFHKSTVDVKVLPCTSDAPRHVDSSILHAGLMRVASMWTMSLWNIPIGVVTTRWTRLLRLAWEMAASIDINWCCTAIRSLSSILQHHSQYTETLNGTDLSTSTATTGTVGLTSAKMAILSEWLVRSKNHVSKASLELRAAAWIGGYCYFGFPSTYVTRLEINRTHDDHCVSNNKTERSSHTRTNSPSTSSDLMVDIFDDEVPCSFFFLHLLSFVRSFHCLYFISLSLVTASLADEEGEREHKIHISIL